MPKGKNQQTSLNFQLKIQYVYPQAGGTAKLDIVVDATSIDVNVVWIPSSLKSTSIIFDFLKNNGLTPDTLAMCFPWF
jgi:hypothetical protein